MKAAASRKSVGQLVGVDTEDNRGIAAEGTGSLQTGKEAAPSASPLHSTALAAGDRESPFAAVPARSGDHHLIQQVLPAMLRGPSPAEFQAQIDDPFYEPNDRLLVRRGGQVIAHARLTKREMHFGPLRLAVAGVFDLAVLPEYRGQGCGTVLLRAAEQRMIEEGALLSTLRTRAPRFFLQRGWCIGSRHSYSVARACDILSHLRERESARPDPLRPPRTQLNIRLWRHVEQAALVRLYCENTSQAFGPLVRGDSYWRWLIDRHAHDRIYVAIRGPDRLELDEALAPIVGYAVMREDRIVEIMTARESPEAAAQLLARACSDAIEHDLHHVRLDAHPDHPLHEIFAAAGGDRYYHEADNGEVFLVKLFDPFAFLLSLGPQLHARAKQANLPLPCELGLNVEGNRYRLDVRPRSADRRRKSGPQLPRMRAGRLRATPPRPPRRDRRRSRRPPGTVHATGSADRRHSVPKTAVVALQLGRPASWTRMIHRLRTPLRVPCVVSCTLR